MPVDETQRHVDAVLREPLEYVTRRMYQMGLVMPQWLTRALQDLARKAFVAGVRAAHEKRTPKVEPSSALWDDDTPLVNVWDDE